MVLVLRDKDIRTDLEAYVLICDESFMLTICLQILNVWNTNFKLLVTIVQNTITKLLTTCGILFLNYGDMWNANPMFLEIYGI